jgi:nicotinamide phosphoribosyltransferase
MSRNGTLVIRPDSGNPAYVIGRILNILGNKFGYTVNEKGYKVLDSHVRIIQGDGVNYDSINLILAEMTIAGWSTDNIAFGMGGALLQNLTRDTQSFAFKCSSINVDGVERPVFKQPVTDSGKKSKAGRLRLIKGYDRYYTETVGDAQDGQDELVTVFENGNVVKEYTFAEVRENASK